MPIYEYKCPDCGYQFAKLEPMHAPAKGRECPRCGKKDACRVISSFSSLGSSSNSGDCSPGG